MLKILQNMSDLEEEVNLMETWASRWPGIHQDLMHMHVVSSEL